MRSKVKILNRYLNQSVTQKKDDSQQAKDQSESNYAAQYTISIFNLYHKTLLFESLLTLIGHCKHNHNDDESHKVYEQQRDIISQWSYNPLSPCEISCSQIFLQDRQYEPVENEYCPIVDLPYCLDERVGLALRFRLI